MKPVFILFFLFASFCTTAQVATCGSDYLREQLLQTDGDYARKDESDRKSLQQSIVARRSNRSSAPVVYTIPVVVHILHIGENVGTGNNLSDLQIKKTIDFLNSIYDGTYVNLENHADVGLRFVLAKRDTSCNGTNGITRHDLSYLPNYVTGGIIYPTTTAIGVEQVVLKDMTRWNPAQYLNIYVVNKISGGMFGTGGSGGFAYYPTVSGRYDGIVLTAGTFVPGGTTLAHEMGHALYLAHPFNGPSSYVCPPNADCTTDGDWVCDTDPIVQPPSWNCRTGINTCTGTNFADNTEHNIMNYNSCPRLFTTGQIERMQATVATLANRISLTTSLGATAPNEGAIQCPPRINFEKEYDSVKAVAVASSGCRKYKDFKYYFTTTNDPLTDAHVTLSVDGGSAVEHVDFDVFGDTARQTPNNIVTFPVIVDSMQPFWLRVYANPSTGSKKNVVLGFNINETGGIAFKGDKYTTLNVVINDSSYAPRLTEFSTVTYGDSLNTTIWSPFDGRKKTMKSQVLYSSTELRRAGLVAGKLTALSLSIRKRSPVGTVYNNVTIKMNQTTRAHLSNSNTADRPFNDQGHAVVFSADVVPVDGWNTFNLSTPFSWDGVSNLVITFCYNNTTSDSLENTGYFKDNSMPGSISDYVFSKSGNCDTAITTYYTYVGYKPSFKFQEIARETVIASDLTGQQEYLGPYSEVYFYDSAQHQIIARIKNLSGFDYGCTSISVDRAGAGATAFITNSSSSFIADKTFKVIPTNNTDTGSYEIALYYTANEINGWESATGQTFDKMQLVKTQSSVSLATPQTPEAAGIIDFTLPKRDAPTNMRILTGTFYTGFSGFAAGVVFSNVYEFTGNGAWTISNNWKDKLVPPATLPGSGAILVDPMEGGECVLNTLQTISKGAIMKVMPGKRLRVVTNVTVQ